MSTQDTRPLRVASFFSGCGGLDLGLEGAFLAHNQGLTDQEADTCNPWTLLPKTRFTTVFANDIMPEARTLWTHYMARFGKDADTFHLRSIVDLVKQWRLGAGPLPQADVVTGGFPCQDFSVAGKRRGFASHKDHLGHLRADASEPSEETRGKLYWWLRESIQLMRPALFIAENVRGLANLAHARDTIAGDFAGPDGGYLVLPPRLLNAADFGVPEHRERIIFIGLRRDRLTADALAALDRETPDPDFDPYPAPTHARDAWPATRPILQGLPEPHQATDPAQQAYSKAKFLTNGSQGQTEIRLDAPAPTIRSEHHGNIEFRRLSADHGGTHDDELSRGLAERRLTPRECALLQSFPPDFPLVGGGLVSPSAAYKVIGNAVPPLLAYRLAQRLQRLWPALFTEA